MTSNNYQFLFHTNQSVEAVFSTLIAPGKWWTGLYNEQIDGVSEKVGDEFSFRAGEGVHFSRQRLIRLEQNSLIEWEVFESNLSFLEETDEWNGTKIRFELQQEAGGTLVRFSHFGLTPEIECYESCSNAWGLYMSKLAKQLSTE